MWKAYIRISGHVAHHERNVESLSSGHSQSYPGGSMSDYTSSCTRPNHAPVAYLFVSTVLLTSSLDNLWLLCFHRFHTIVNTVHVCEDFWLKIIPAIGTINIFFSKCTQWYNIHDIRKLLRVSVPRCHLK